MKDFNFFEPYIVTRGSPTYKILILRITVSIGVLGLVIYPLVNVFKINSLKKNVTTMKINLGASGIYERLHVVEHKQEKVSEMEERLSFLENADRVIESRDGINDLLLSKITSRVPKDVFLRSLKFSSDQIQIRGTAINNLAVAHLESNLKSDKDFKDIYISNILLDGGLYNFSINLVLETTEENGREQEDIKQDDVEQKDMKQNETE